MNLLKRAICLLPIYISFSLFGIACFFLFIGILKFSAPALVAASIVFIVILVANVVPIVLMLQNQRQRMRHGSQDPPIIAEAILRMAAPKRFRDNVLCEVSEQFVEIFNSDGIAAARKYYWWEVRALVLNLVICSIVDLLFDSLKNPTIMDILHKRQYAK